MPNFDLVGIQQRIDNLEKILDRADKISRRSLTVAYVSLGASVAAIIVSIIPFIPY